jgi:hypothetical protein
MRVHLVTYATPRFRHREWILGLSARLAGVADTVTAWTPKRLLGAGFEQRCQGIALSERGSGFWAWKPFIIAAKLREVPDGDLVFYCDVGRRFPYKFLDRSIAPFQQWMRENHQDFLPGVQIGWRGPLAIWTKRDAFVLTGMDSPQVHEAPTVQASFSLWRAGNSSRAFVSQWLDLCSRRQLISDDASTCGLPELPGFHEHRHDQSLLTLSCLKAGAKVLELGDRPLPIDTRDPAQVLDHLFLTAPTHSGIAWCALKSAAIILEVLELLSRRFVKFGSDAPPHPLARD